jgi:hypothetical protein
VPRGGATRQLRLIKCIFPTFASPKVFLVGRPFRRAAPPGKKNGFAFCRVHYCVGAARTMKLFRTAFWLGVVIYNLPSPVSQSGAPALAAKAASQFGPKPVELCAKTVAAFSKRGEPGGHNSLRDAGKPSQDTLTSADRMVPWCGAIQHKGPVAKRSV